MAKVVHFEVPVDDPERARRFYSSVFGWRLDAFGDEGYWLATAGPPEEGGADGALIRRSELHATPVVVVAVESVDACLAAAEGAGAEVLVGRQEIPSVGYSAYLRDSENNVIGIFEPVAEVDG
jgi:uncharacterized protein